MNWRIIAIVVLMSMSLLDLSLTFYYVNQYHKWQPDKPYNLMENNPLLVFLWNNLGLIAGTIIGGIIILTLIFLVAKTAHPIIIGLVFLVLCYALFNHFSNISLLKDLIIKFPSGKLPESIGK